MIKSAIGLRQAARITELAIKTSKNGFPYLSMKIVAKKTTHPKSEDRVFYKNIVTWKDMSQDRKEQLKENLQQLLEAYEVQNAQSVVKARYNSAFDLFAAVVEALPKNYKKVLVDIFLEFEYKLDTEKSERTWPTVADGGSGVANGKAWRSFWITAAQDGEFKTVVEERDGKSYLNFVNEDGTKHLISRGPNWFNGKSNLPQGEIKEFNAQAAASPTPPQQPQQPQPSNEEQQSDDDLPF